MKKMKENKGITLIALVITIIVLLILAGVSLRLVAGNEGILNRAEKAVSKSNTESLKEEIELAISELRIAYYDGEDVPEGVTSPDEYIQTKLNGKKIPSGIIIFDKDTGKLSLSDSNNKTEEIGTYSPEKGVTINKGEGNTSTIVEGSIDDWDVTEEGILRRYKSNKIPENGKVIIPNVVGGISIKKLEKGGKDEFGDAIFPRNEEGLYGAGITELIISEGISEIGVNAFMGLRDLKTLSIPSSVIKIGSWGFNISSGNLTTINYGGRKEDWEKIEIGNYNEFINNAQIICSDGIIER